MTVGSSSIPSLLENALAIEKEENNSLIHILGIVRPTKASQTGITSIIRGLFTRNKTLLQILNNYISQINEGPDTDHRPIFKSFINEFVLWCEDDILLLFSKYHKCLMEYEFSDKNSEDIEYFTRPLLHLNRYVDFIADALTIVRNPYIVDNLSRFSMGCSALVDSFLSDQKQSDLNNINFNNVQIFGDSSKVSEKVCSYFKIDQIVERTDGSRLTFQHSSGKVVSVELLLLNLGDTSKMGYNALGLVSIPQDSSSRSLLFPPFRINELLLTYSQSKCQIIFKTINFVRQDNVKKRDSITINCADEAFLQDWIEKLAAIFPLERSDSPTASNFILKANETSMKMSGLGIDMLSDSSQIGPEEASPKSPHRKPPSPPTTASALPAPKPLRNKPSFASSIEEFKQPRIPQFVHKSRSSSTSSSSSIPSDNSPEVSAGPRRSSLELMQKTLSHSSSASRKNNNYIQKVDRLVPVTNHTPKEERPLSASAEIEDSPEIPLSKIPSVVSVDQHEEPIDSKSSLYKLSTGSEVDISNFGQSYNPSFSVHRGLNEMQQERPKSKFFGFFKKSSKPKSTSAPQKSTPAAKEAVKPVAKAPEQRKPRPDTPKTLPTATPKIRKKSSVPKLAKPGNLKIDTVPVDSDSDTTIPLSANSVMSSNSTLSKGDGTRSITNHKNSSGSAFALPSSTSTQFFKPKAPASGSNANNSSSSLAVGEEEELVIAQELKDQINDDGTIDFFVTESTPKALKISKWKPKYGKWEMLTVNENVFVKIVVNYDLGKAWLIPFKEEFSEQDNEMLDVPIVLLDITAETEATASATLDIQISSRNSLTNEVMLIMIRCRTSELAGSILANIKNTKGALFPRPLTHKYSSSSLGTSRQTIASSVMDETRSASKSSTMTSMNSVNKAAPRLAEKPSLASIASQDLNRAVVLNNPNNTKMVLLQNMTVRLQQQLESYESITNPSSWKIVAMYSLSVSVIADHFTDTNYYHVQLDHAEPEKSYTWLVSEDEKFRRFERIGRAGLLVNMAADELYMIECKGKRELKQLLEVL